MIYMDIRLKPRFNILQYNITHHLYPYEVPILSTENGQNIMAEGEILKHAMEIIRAAYDIRVQVKEWDIRDGEEED